MRTNQLIPILAFLIASPFATGQDTTPKDPRWKQLSQAYGFVLGQQASLTLIEQKFEDLAPDVKQAWFAFNASALGESVKGMEGELFTELGDKWPSMKEKMAKQMEEMVNGQQFTRDQAVAFLAEVTSRSKGRLPDSIRAALLSAHPRFSKNPGLELIEGWKQTFRSKGHPKAKGADFSLSFPASWSKREGSRPNVIQVFQSGAGHGAIVATLMVKDIPLPAGYKSTEEEVKELFQPDALKEIVNGGEDLVDAKSIVLDGSPAGMVVSDQTKQRLDVTLKIRTTQFVTLQGSSMIFIQFMVAKMPDTTQSLDELQKLYVPTYKAIANTFIFNDKYK
ncbi:MAG: hypothetical protein WCP35_17970 [Verrucomicrobiota bacterium]